MLVLAKHIGLISIYFLGILIVFLSLTGRVKYGLLFLIPLLPLQNVFQRLQGFPLGKDFNDILLISMIIGWFFYKNYHREPVFEKTSYNKVIFFYLFFTYLNLWHGSSYLELPAPISALDLRVQAWKNYMIFPLLFLLTFNNIKDKRDIKRIFILMCLSIFLMNFFCRTILIKRSPTKVAKYAAREKRNKSQ